MFIRKLQMPQRSMPTAEEFALWGAYELSFEELLEVNGGKRKKKEKSSGSSGGGSSDSSGSAGGSSGSSHSSRSARTSSSSNASSKSKEKKNKNSKTQSGTPAFDEKKSKPPVQSSTPSVNSPNAEESKRNEEKQSGAAEYTVQKGDTLSGIIRKQYPGASKEEIVRRVKEAAAHSGIKDIDKIEPGQKILFEKPAQSSSGQPNAGEATSPTQGGSTRRGSRPPSNSGSSGSFTSTSSGDSSSSGGDSSSSGNTDSDGSAWFNGRRNRGGDWQGGKNPRMPPDWGTKEKQHTEGQEKGQDAGADFTAPQEKKGLGEKISGWFNGKRKDVVGMCDWGKRKLDSIGQGIAAGMTNAMNSRLRMFSELTGIGKVQNGKKDGAVLMTANTAQNTGMPPEASNTANNGIRHQTATNEGFHCDVIAWNSALDNNLDPRGQNGETWDANNLTVNQILDYYPNNRNNTPVANTEGYVFYDWHNDNVFDHMEHYEAGSGTNYTVWQTDGRDDPILRAYDSLQDSNGSGAPGATAIFVPLNRQ